MTYSFLDRMNHIQSKFDFVFYVKYIRFLKDKNLYLTLIKQKNILFSKYPETPFEVLIGTYDILHNDITLYTSFMKEIPYSEVYKYFKDNSSIMHKINIFLKTYSWYTMTSNQQH